MANSKTLLGTRSMHWQKFNLYARPFDSLSHAFDGLTDNWSPVLLHHAIARQDEAGGALNIRYRTVKHLWFIRDSPSPRR